LWRKDANYCRSTNDKGSDRILVLLQNLHLLRMRHGQPARTDPLSKSVYRLTTPWPLQHPAGF
ncbi:hypothetical protein, partial [Mesorhizobium sp. M7A.F.Ca.CA.002.03.2.1]|uniref:hypothetical protein n=1 Tax=Mesorhizobium sp. M7A.F.Ca.CA.002.03.2.1 TaxID=2496680 RepID=UPI0019D461C0